MIIGIGTDIIEIERIKNAIQTRPKLVERIFTPLEVEYCQKSGDFFASLAARFAAKEAVAKALGTGIRDFKWVDIEVVNDGMGKPGIKTYGNAAEIMASLGADAVHVSLSHCRLSAVAMVVLERR